MTRFLNITIKILLVICLVYALYYFGAFNLAKKYLGASGYPKDITSKESAMSVAIIFNSLGAKIDKCSQVIDVGKAVDHTIGDCDVLWVTCDGTNYTLKQQVVSKELEMKRMSLVFKGWVK